MALRILVTKVLAGSAPVPEETVTTLFTNNPAVLATVIVLPLLEAPDIVIPIVPLFPSTLMLPPFWVNTPPELCKKNPLIVRVPPVLTVKNPPLLIVRLEALPEDKPTVNVLALTVKKPLVIAKVLTLASASKVIAAPLATIKLLALLIDVGAAPEPSELVPQLEVLVKEVALALEK